VDTEGADLDKATTYAEPVCGGGDLDEALCVSPIATVEVQKLSS
jgi:hypothetical protein